ncbi:MAG: serine hydrolase [Thermomicrobiales bacterium]
MAQQNSTSSRWDDLAQAIAQAPQDARVAVTAIDLKNDEQYAVGGNDPFKAASTIKTLILAAIARAVDAGRLDLTQPIALPERLKVGGSGVLNWMTNGIDIPLTDHAWLMSATSDNTASNVCIEAATLPAIQEMADELGLKDLKLGRFFLGRSPAPGEPENIATTDDLATLLAAIEASKVSSPAQTAWMLKLLADQQHVDRLPRSLPGGVSYAGKTGSLEGIAHDCGILTGPKGSLAIAVLTEGIPDKYAADAFIGEIGNRAALTLT